MKSAQPKRYQIGLKESVARRYVTTGASYRELAEEIGGSTWSIRGWVRELREQGSVGKKRKNKPSSTNTRSPQDKLRLLLEARGLSDADRGEFLRREGVHDGDLERWEQEALRGLRGGENQSRVS